MSEEVHNQSTKFSFLFMQIKIISLSIQSSIHPAYHPAILSKTNTNKINSTDIQPAQHNQIDEPIVNIFIGIAQIDMILW